MSVRNIEQGIYNLPDTTITLNTSIAFNKTITANINVLNGTVTLTLPPILGAIINSVLLHFLYLTNIHFQLY